MAEEVASLEELRTNLTEYEEQLEQVIKWVEVLCTNILRRCMGWFLIACRFNNIFVHVAQVGQLLLDDPNNEEYSGLYSNLHEVGIWEDSF